MIPFTQSNSGLSYAIIANNKFSQILFENVFFICKKKQPPFKFFGSSHNGFIPYLNKNTSEPPGKFLGLLNYE